MENTLLTPSQLAKRWVIKPETLGQWRWNGKGPQFMKIGRRVLYRLEDVEIFEKQKIYANTAQLNNMREKVGSR